MCDNALLLVFTIPKAENEWHDNENHSENRFVYEYKKKEKKSTGYFPICSSIRLSHIAEEEMFSIRNFAHYSHRVLLLNKVLLLLLLPQQKLAKTSNPPLSTLQKQTMFVAFGKRFGLWIGIHSHMELRVYWLHLEWNSLQTSKL